MADENKVTIIHAYSDTNGVELGRFEGRETLTDCGTLTPMHRLQSIGITEEVLDLNAITVAGALLVGINRDDTNYMEIRPVSGATKDAIKVLPGEPVCFRFGPTITAPYVIANTAAVLFEYRLIPA